MAYFYKRLLIQRRSVDDIGSPKEAEVECSRPTTSKVLGNSEGEIGHIEWGNRSPNDFRLFKKFKSHSSIVQEDGLVRHKMEANNTSERKQNVRKTFYKENNCEDDCSRAAVLKVHQKVPDKFPLKEFNGHANLVITECGEKPVNNDNSMITSIYRELVKRKYADDGVFEITPKKKYPKLVPHHQVGHNFATYEVEKTPQAGVIEHSVSSPMYHNRWSSQPSNVDQQNKLIKEESYQKNYQKTTSFDTEALDEPLDLSFPLMRENFRGIRQSSLEDNCALKARQVDKHTGDALYQQGAQDYTRKIETLPEIGTENQSVESLREHNRKSGQAIIDLIKALERCIKESGEMDQVVPVSRSNPYMAQEFINYERTPGENVDPKLVATPRSCNHQNPVEQCIKHERTACTRMDSKQDLAVPRRSDQYLVQQLISYEGIPDENVEYTQEAAVPRSIENQNPGQQCIENECTTCKEVESKQEVTASQYYNPKMVRQFICHERTPDEKQKRSRNNVASKQSRFLANKNAESIIESLNQTEAEIFNHQAQFSKSIEAFKLLYSYYEECNSDAEGDLLQCLRQWED